MHQFNKNTPTKNGEKLKFQISYALSDMGFLKFTNRMLNVHLLQKLIKPLPFGLVRKLY